MPPTPRPAVRVRMYRQGLGDCFLVTFDDGNTPRHMVIDCGTLGARLTNVDMDDVVDDIAAITNNHLDLLVLTHEHKDHLSGFNSAKSQWDGITVDRVWVAWTENPNDSKAVDLKKYSNDLAMSLAMAANTLAAVNGGGATQTKAAHEAAGDVRQLLGFVGDVPGEGQPMLGAFAKTVHQAMSYASFKGPGKPSYLKPGSVKRPAWLPGVRFYVLGPPRDDAKLRNLGEHGDPELYSLAGQLGADISACAAFAASGQPFRDYRDSLSASERVDLERRLPFDPRFRLESAEESARREQFAAYFDDQNDWRRIDHDWLAASTDLALQLDNLTNNTSLVLAIELIRDRIILLFAADAQLGNWLSWHDHSFKINDNGTMKVVKAADLLARTVLYKVGHHSSHNATVTTQGLEMMVRDDLVAIIPVDTEVAKAKRPHPWIMPAEALYTRLLEKTTGRVLRSDIGWAADADRPDTVTKQKWDQARAQINSRVTISDLAVEVRI
ncbi:MAG TPA: hypothetical protein VJ672_13390 [Gemmatimonadaceae bacterium]|nr:hypothetical protein [Gemmatimonadaceae bacterium]